MSFNHGIKTKNKYSSLCRSLGMNRMDVKLLYKLIDTDLTLYMKQKIHFGRLQQSNGSILTCYIYTIQNKISCNYLHFFFFFLLL